MQKCVNDVTYGQSFVTLLALIFAPLFMENNAFNTNKMKAAIELKGNWNETKAKLKQKFAMLTDSDLLLIEGKQDEIISRLQIKLGKSKEEIKKLISEL